MVQYLKDLICIKFFTSIILYFSHVSPNYLFLKNYPNNPLFHIRNQDSQELHHSPTLLSWWVKEPSDNPGYSVQSTTRCTIQGEKPKEDRDPHQGICLFYHRQKSLKSICENVQDPLGVLKAIRIWNENRSSRYFSGTGLRDCSVAGFSFTPADVSFCTSLRRLICLSFKAVLTDHSMGQQNGSSFPPTVTTPQHHLLRLSHLRCLTQHEARTNWLSMT